jgi:putative heme-binding domain-containing protein
VISISIPKSSALALLLLAASTVVAVAGSPDALPGHVQVAPGYTAQLVAAPPLVQWPIVASLAPDGSLLVAEAAGRIENVQLDQEARPHRLVRLRDTDGDGRYDERQVVAEQLSFPEGVLALEDRVLVSAPPQILEFADTTGDGVLDHRSIWYDPGTLTGCANDLHGPYLGPDGWVYWCKGAFAEQHHVGADGEVWASRASHILRRRPDGGPVEAVLTGGMDNPIGLAFSSAGERFLTSTFLQFPADGRRDGLVHAIYGGVYGKPHGVLDGHPRTGDLMPITHHFGPAAPSGMAPIDWRWPGAESESAVRLAVSLFNLSKVVQVDLVPEGASFRSHQRDLLWSGRVDFHPTDVVRDADGSLLVIDTGGWYDLCCPTSRIDQNQALGGIYRLQANDPAPLSEAQRALQHDLEQIWQWCRAGSEAALQQVADQLSDAQASPSIQAASLHALSVHRDGRWRPLAEALVGAGRDPQVRRVAAEYLGRIGSPESLPVLVESLASVDHDRALEHSLIYAMIEIGRDLPLRGYLADARPQVRRGVTLALLASGDAPLPWGSLQWLLQHGRSSDAQLAMGHLLQVPGLAPEALAFASLWLSGESDQAAGLSDERLELLATTLARQPSLSESLAELLAERLRLATGGAAPLGPVLKLSKAAQFQRLPSSLAAALLDCFDAPQIAATLGASDLARLVELVTASRWPDDLKVRRDATLARVALQPQLPSGVRLLALAGRGSGPAMIDGASLVELVLEQFSAAGAGEAEHSDRPASDGAEAESADSGSTEGATPGRVSLTAAQLAATLPQLNWGGDRQRLLAAIEHLPPVTLGAIMPALAGLLDDDWQQQLLERLAQLPAAKTLPPDLLAELYRGRAERLVTLADQLSTQGRLSWDEVDRLLDRMEQRLVAGDPIAGFEIFRSSKAACSACHTIGYVGGKVGPDLTRIGQIRSRRDLIEAIVLPSQRFVQSYQPLRVLTVDGQVINGLLVREDDQVLVLQTGAEQQQRIERAEVEDIQPSMVSIMPAGLDEQLTPQEFSDLIAFLESLR